MLLKCSFFSGYKQHGCRRCGKLVPPSQFLPPKNREQGSISTYFTNLAFPYTNTRSEFTLDTLCMHLCRGSISPRLPFPPACWRFVRGLLSRPLHRSGLSFDGGYSFMHREAREVNGRRNKIVSSHSPCELKRVFCARLSHPRAPMYAWHLRCLSDLVSILSRCNSTHPPNVVTNPSTIPILITPAFLRSRFVHICWLVLVGRKLHLVRLTKKQTRNV